MTVRSVLADSRPTRLAPPVPRIVGQVEPAGVEPGADPARRYAFWISWLPVHAVRHRVEDLLTGPAAGGVALAGLDQDRAVQLWILEPVGRVLEPSDRGVQEVVVRIAHPHVYFTACEFRAEGRPILFQMQL